MNRKEMNAIKDIAGIEGLSKQIYLEADKLQEYIKKDYDRTLVVYKNQIKDLKTISKDIKDLIEEIEKIYSRLPKAK